MCGALTQQLSSESSVTIIGPNSSIHHAAKWGIEGFVESVPEEMAPFGVDFAIVEPGSTSARFGRVSITPRHL